VIVDFHIKKSKERVIAFRWVMWLGVYVDIEYLFKNDVLGETYPQEDQTNQLQQSFTVKMK
jgi:hypothetical protein